MAKPNYAFAKRQRELAKKQKKEEKTKRKTTESGAPESADAQDQIGQDTPNRPPEDGQTPST